MIRNWFRKRKLKIRHKERLIKNWELPNQRFETCIEELNMESAKKNYRYDKRSRTTDKE